MPHQLHKAPLRVVIVFVLLEVLSYLLDPLGNDSNLHLRGAAIPLMDSEFLDNGLFVTLSQLVTPNIEL